MRVSTNINVYKAIYTYTASSKCFTRITTLHRDYAELMRRHIEDGDEALVY